jgi:2-C-methyl-D-erythritol 4-phosphate cytidylyltransferase / 2-C-methyl-D-erythritol 2,4-cyclodiphosphate synthase
MTTAVVIVAAGSGSRAGGDIPKQYHLLGGQAVLRLTALAFARHPAVDRIQMVIGEGHEQLYRPAVEGLDLPPPVLGGATRQVSARNGLEALATSPPDRVLIHDAARPFVSSALIDRVIAALDVHPAAIPGLPVADTLKRIDGERVSATVERAGLMAVQTPQGFRYDLIRDAHRRAADEQVTDMTDDSAIAEWAGLTVAVVAGEPENRKLTTAGDLSEAEWRRSMQAMLATGDIRVGQGFDVHGFEPGDAVMLCGVSIPHEQRLSGHSDADAPLHAVTDAILGAIGEGDIGVHFPPSDPQWRGADSAVFLRHAVQLLAARGGLIANVDITIVAEAPKIAPHVAAMRARLSEILGIKGDRIGIKATTSEKLGFTGRREGLVAMATATVRLPWEG